VGWLRQAGEEETWQLPMELDVWLFRARTVAGIEVGCEAGSPYTIYRSVDDVRHRGKRWVARGGGRLMKPTISKP
jgi:hypothetical protein